jgi:hypothetical protein
MRPYYKTNRVKHFDVCHSFDVLSEGHGPCVAEHRGIEIAFYLTPNGSMEFRGQREVLAPGSLMVLNGLEKHTELHDL